MNREICGRCGDLLVASPKCLEVGRKGMDGDMTYKPSKCLQYMDDNPGQRAWCADMRQRGDWCFHCPHHPDSPELAIAALQSELAAERIKREAAERRLALVTGPMMSFDDWMTSRNQKYRPSDDTLALRELRECWRTAAGHSKLPKLEARLHDLGQAARP